MINFCNALSVARGPLALFFLWEEPFIRLVAIVLAMITDVLDGYLARRFGWTTKVGAFLDPLMDRIFVLFCLGVLVSEQRVQLGEVVAMLCRDFSILLFTGYVWVSQAWSQYHMRALWCGKATTILQFLVLLCVVLQSPIPPQIYTLFWVLALLALVEMKFLNRSPALSPSKD